MNICYLPCGRFTGALFVFVPALLADSFRSGNKDPQMQTKQKKVGRCPRGVTEEESACSGGLLALMHSIEFQLYLFCDAAMEVENGGPSC